MNKGDIIPLNSGMYNYEIPLKQPSDEKEIINFDKPKSEQIWHPYVIQNVKAMSARERISFIEMERQRWAEGCYVLINGEAIFLSPIHFDHLTYMTFKGGKAEYFDHQRFDFYFRDMTRRDPKCRGRVWMKPRRYGMTMEETTEATYSLMENFSNNVGLQSDTKEKVRTTLLAPIINSFAKRPKFMRPDYYKPNGKLLVTELSSKSNVAPNDEGEYEGDYILGWLKGYPALPRAMDGEEMAYIVDDEVWKWQESSPKETIESNMKVLMGRNRSGMISVLSTMGDSDDYINAVMDGCDIIAKSNPNIRNENGYTLSGLYEYFVSAIYSFDIPPEIFEIDKFGKVNKDKHLEYVQNKINALDKNSKGYIFEKRRLPLCKEDALLSAQLNTYFRKVVINSRLNTIRAMTASQKMDVYVRGNLVEDIKGNVWFEQHDEGIWLWALLPYFSEEKRVDTRNRYSKGGGFFYPPMNPEGAIGYDPINYDKNLVTSSHLSRAAAIIHKKHDYFNKPDDKNYSADTKMALMIYRPDDPHEANHEVMKAAKFTGYPVMHEKSVSHVYEDFRDAGMLAFLMKDENGNYGIAQSNVKAKKDGLAMLQTRYAAPKDPNEKDQLEEYPFEEGLMDLDNFDINNTTPFDVTMAEIMCEHGLKQIIFTNQNDRSVMDKLKAVHEIIPARRH
jgi:hypothetical protein